MDDPFERLGGETFDAAIAHHEFLAVIVGRLVAAGALTTLDVSDAIESERKVIEALRREGDDPRLLAEASDVLVGSLERTLAGLGLSLLPWSRWSLDPGDPLWPGTADNDD